MMLVHATGIPGQYVVKWEWDARAKRHVITYGSHQYRRACDVDASEEYGRCIRHALECAGVLDEITEN